MLQTKAKSDPNNTNSNRRNVEYIYENSSRQIHRRKTRVKIGVTALKLSKMWSVETIIIAYICMHSRHALSRIRIILNTVCIKED